jgi:HD superfamily phosphohydrolase
MDAVMTKHVHEFRDPIHGFIRVDSKERLVVDSKPVQRLRHIHQLALTYLLYPGATHRRFEHSLGVMELAGRAYDTVTDPNNILHDAVRDLVPEHNKRDHQYWRCVVRMAALCHDVGHLPFSHAAEDLLPKGYNHELLTIDLVESDEMKPIWSELSIHADHVAKIAVGPRKYRKSAFKPWESILSEIIIGDAFGVDRIDYLLRDSHHAGVGYGRFDHIRLLDNLRILPKTYTEGGELSLGVELRASAHSGQSGWTCVLVD